MLNIMRMFMQLVDHDAVMCMDASFASSSTLAFPNNLLTTNSFFLVYITEAPNYEEKLPFLGNLPFMLEILPFSTYFCPFSEKIVPFFLVCPLGMVNSSGPLFIRVLICKQSGSNAEVKPLF